MSETIQINNEDLQKYVDGQLDETCKTAVESYLSMHPEQAEYVRMLKKQNQLLHSSFDGILDEPVPAQLLRSLTSRPTHRYRNIIAIAASLLIGVALGFVTRGEIKPTTISYNTFTERASLAHVLYTAEILHPVEVAVDQEKHLIQWLSKRLGHTLHTPDLTSFGYQMMGGRLLPGNTAAAAQFMYQDKNGKRLTLYVSIIDQGTKQTAFRMHEEKSMQVLYWIDNDLGFALIGDIDRGQLLEIGKVTYKATS